MAKLPFQISAAPHSTGWSEGFQFICMFKKKFKKGKGGKQPVSLGQAKKLFWVRLLL